MTKEKIVGIELEGGCSRGTRIAAGGRVQEWARVQGLGARILRPSFTLSGTILGLPLG